MMSALTKNYLEVFFQHKVINLCVEFQICQTPSTVFCQFLANMGWECFSFNICIHVQLFNSQNWNYQIWAKIEKQIRDYGEKAKDGKLAIEEMTGGTFTISNGGVFGSLLSTPILNPPQTAILGMHKIQERPMAVDGEVRILPMMYLALSYDHRMIDGKEAVQFLVAIKELLEDPTRILLEI